MGRARCEADNMFTKPGVGKTRGMSKPAYCRDSEGGGGGTARRAGFVGAALAVQRQFHEGAQALRSRIEMTSGVAKLRILRCVNF